MSKEKTLEKYHKRAIELKYKGKSYDEIAETLDQEFKKNRVGKFTKQTIADYFKEAGTLYEAYRQYEDEWDTINRELRTAALKAGVQILESNFRMTCEMLIALLGSEKDIVKLGAIREILDRVVGKAKQPIELGGNVGVNLNKHEHRLEEARKIYGDDN